MFCDCDLLFLRCKWKWFRGRYCVRVLYTADLANEVQQHQLNLHDSQITLPSSVDWLERCCLSDVNHRMSANRLKLNIERKKLLCAGCCIRQQRSVSRACWRKSVSPRQFLLREKNSNVSLRDIRTRMSLSETFESLALFFSSDLSLDKHVSNVTATCFYWLCQLDDQSLDTDSLTTLVHAFIMSSRWTWTCPWSQLLHNAVLPNHLSVITDTQTTRAERCSHAVSSPTLKVRLRHATTAARPTALARCSTATALQARSFLWCIGVWRRSVDFYPPISYVGISALSVDITWPYRATDEVHLTVGPSLSRVRWPGTHTHCRMISVTRRAVASVLGKPRRQHFLLLYSAQ